ncbi:MAG TPA: PQQ-binding-like beta-propeller repeat protein, partial [Gammaproteobacteria bacterium]|nr:PQQ-binding-like beta-propeller repeat protein [Gammaproteobacteria bacterium]
MRRLISISLSLSLPLLTAGSAFAQTPDGEALFAQHCMACHLTPAPDPEIPGREQLERLDPDVIVAALTDGAMRIQGMPLTQAERIAIAETVTHKRVAAQVAASSTAQCTAPPSSKSAPEWNGWSPDVHNTRFQRDAGGLTAASVPSLKLKWAFGVPNVTQSRSQPAVVGGKLYMASASGEVYALDPKTGCTYWTYKAQSGVRTAISVGPVGPKGAPTGTAIYFADAQARAYAVDADTGKELWTRKVDDHPAARATGAPTLY